MSETAERPAIPKSYGDTAKEYQAVRGEGAGLFDLSARGRLRVSGTEAVMFLNGLITNDVKTLPDGAWMKAAFPNAQGRLLAMARVLRQGNEFLLDTEAATAAQVANIVGRFVFAGDFRVADEGPTTAHFALAGNNAAAIVSQVIGPQAACVTHGNSRVLDWQGHNITVMRFRHTGTDGFDCLVDATRGAALRDALKKAGAQSVGAEVWETLRIEAGIPRYGVDMDDTTVVLETGQDDAVSYTKGCYIGQEIIARIHWRGHVAKRLAGLQCARPAEIRRDAEIQSPEGQAIGRVTSATHSPQLGCAIALGYVRYAHLAPGTEVRIADANGQQTPARVVELPFIKQ
jgi:folate-binding protein YgfZ